MGITKMLKLMEGIEMDKRIASNVLIGCGSFVIIVYVCLIVGSHFLSTPGRGIKNAERDIQENKELFNIVMNFLAELESDSVYIPYYESARMMSVGGHGDVSIEDERVVEAILQLRKRGYDNVAKEGLCIDFSRGSFVEFYYGIAYSIDGHVPDESSIQFLTMIEPLSENGWYYYEEDYNKWREFRKSK